jgi:hypothetical protein
MGNISAIICCAAKALEITLPFFEVLLRMHEQQPKEFHHEVKRLVSKTLRTNNQLDGESRMRLASLQQLVIDDTLKQKCNPNQRRINLETLLPAQKTYKQLNMHDMLQLRNQYPDSFSDIFDQIILLYLQKPSQMTLHRADLFQLFTLIKN